MHTVFAAIQDKEGDYVWTMASDQSPVNSVCQLRAPIEQFVAVGVVISGKFEIDASRNNVLFLTCK